ncbi:Cold shock protein [Bifidobacterium [indicum] DSM 20214 = LMG 11587]|uniref:Cold shock protein n=1 Tax=Bifidobacterium [indicum] DSM 20214 = LMG 11587 TaxID=1341694 RepID=A0A087VUW5_9BIFI|nr:Cold shock protein [Bifidobacterium indicum LMG 11587 = DSM 20214]
MAQGTVRNSSALARVTDSSTPTMAGKMSSSTIRLFSRMVSRPLMREIRSNIRLSRARRAFRQPRSPRSDCRSEFVFFIKALV